ncbi:MAG TPA: hypothetical protein VMJ49_01045 [Gaiellaceae bacterium]|nr:hypothetical protein [Gaiellaceae bacterium]
MTAHLRVMVLPDRKTEFIDLTADETIEQVLQDFLRRAGRFEGEWVPIRSGAQDMRFVRYDQIVLVEATQI